MDGTRFMTVIFRERDRAGVEQFAQDVSLPRDDGAPSVQHWNREQLWQHVKLEDAALQEVRDWFLQGGMTVLDQEHPNPQRLVVRATDDQIKRAFGQDPEAWQEQEMDVRRAPRIALGGRLDGYVQKISGAVGDPRTGRRIYPLVEEADQPAAGAGMDLLAGHAHPEPQGGLTPADIRRIYNFPSNWDGRGETIALQMLDGHVDVEVLQRFWTAHGITRSDPEIIQVGPKSQDRPRNPIHDVEAAMSVEWAGALAPGARLVVYCIDPNVFHDPWSAFLMELIADATNAPTVASTSWVSPERDYYRKHGHKVIVGLLAQAACLGISIVAAAGDWGPFDGIPHPKRKVGGQLVADAPWPHGVFPAVEEGVLGVGGTMITVLDPLTEVAWTGPLPTPLQGLLRQMRSLSGSGGFSDAVPIPAWQEPAFRAYYPRGTSSPAVVPYGRGFPDVALMASGPAIQPSSDAPAMSCRGYQALTGAGWIDFAVGTSVGAPIWAAILALANQARREGGTGLGPVGWVNPLLYQLRTKQPSPYRAVLAGSADAVMLAANGEGQAVPYHLDGYQCFEGWDPVTGLGVPDVARLVEYLCGRTPPS